MNITIILEDKTLEAIKGLTAALLGNVEHESGLTPIITFSKEKVPEPIKKAVENHIPEDPEPLPEIKEPVAEEPKGKKVDEAELRAKVEELARTLVRGPLKPQVISMVAQKKIGRISECDFDRLPEVHQALLKIQDTSEDNIPF